MYRRLEILEMMGTTHDGMVRLPVNGLVESMDRLPLSWEGRLKVTSDSSTVSRESYADQVIKRDGYSGGNRMFRAQHYKGGSSRVLSKDSRSQEPPRFYVPRRRNSVWLQALYAARPGIAEDSMVQVENLVLEVMTRDKGKAIAVAEATDDGKMFVTMEDSLIDKDDILVEDGEMVNEGEVTIEDNAGGESYTGFISDQHDAIVSLEEDLKSMEVDTTFAEGSNGDEMGETMEPADLSEFVNEGTKKVANVSKGGTLGSVPSKLTKKGMVAPLNQPAHP